MRLHGELLAFGWVEQHTGHTSASQPGAVAGCYRATAAGLRALKQAVAQRDEDQQCLAAEAA